MPPKPIVLLDTSVLITALNSTTGASAYLLNAARDGKIQLLTTPYILDETEEVVSRKFPRLLPLLQNLLDENLLSAVPNPPLPLVQIALQIIGDPKDAPILAAAMKCNIDYLITLDRQDFIKDPTVSQKSGITITTPAGLTRRLKTQGQ